MPSLAAYVPMDRRLALARGETLPDRTTGAVLFADISGFTRLTEALAAELGRKRGAEEVLRHLNPVYEALIATLYRYGGSVIGFPGDAITCWLDDGQMSAASLQASGMKKANGSKASLGFLPIGNANARATACALAMQERMRPFAVAQTPTGTAVRLGLKVAVAAGPARRFLVGDPDIQVLEVLAGDTLARMASAEGQATTGEVLVSEEVATALADSLQIAEWRQDSATGNRSAVVTRLSKPVTETSWPLLDPSRLTEEQLRPWLLPAVYHRLQAGQQFLGDLRPVTPLFLKFGGIDYDQDEAAGEKLDAYVRWVQSVLERYEGSLIQLTVGDKGSFWYAAFGALLAHEDDPTRALMAALALQEPPPALSYIGPVQIGITQGQVWTGACGGSTRHDYSVMGNPVNMAARLMVEAKPGQVLVSRSAADLAQGRIRFHDLGAIPVKGRATPLPVAEAVLVEAAGRHVSDQFEQPMVGRDEELTQLLTLLDEIEAGESRVVILEAAAGLGKSRLVAEWAGHIRHRGWRGFLGAAQSIEQHTPYRAWRDLLSSFLGLDGLTDLAERQAQVERRVHALAPDAAVYIPLLNDILDLALPDNDLSKGLSAQGRQQALITLLLALFRAAAAQSPLLLVLEDVHWLDAVSWELALQLARGLQVTGAPFMLLLVTRPVDDPPAAAVTLRRLPYSRHLPLNSLPPEPITALMANHLGVAADSLPADLITLVQSRAEGNPFFAEELLLNLQAHGVVTVRPDPESGRPRCQLQKELGKVATALPDSLQGVILARIDRLPPGQQLVLKLAAVIGRAFAYPPLQYLYRHYRTAQAVVLAAEIAQLEEKDFVLTEALEPELTYLFKHIVIREVAYETLLYEQRQPLHRSVAAWYEQAHQGEAADSPYLPLLAHHYGQAEEVDQERRYAHLAGQQAAARYANEAALTYLNRALELTTDSVGQYQVLWAREEIYSRLGEREAQAADLGQLTALAGTVAQEVAVALRYGAYHNNVGDYEAARAVSEQAYQWTAERGDDAGQAQAMIHSGRALMQQGEYERASQRYQRAYELAQGATAPTQIAHAWGGLGEVAFRQGDYATATQYHQQALRLRQELGDRPGQVQSLRNLGQVAKVQGEYETARDHLLQALQLAQQMGDRPNEGRLLLDLGESDWRQGAYPRAEKYSQQSLTLAQTTGDRFTAANSLRNLGIVAFFQGQNVRAIDYFEQSLVIAQEIGDREGAGKTLNNLGIVLSVQGQYDRAMVYWEQSLAIQQEIGDRNGESATLNNLGIAAMGEGQYDRAIGYYEQSLVILQEIGNRTGEGLALHNLGNAARYQGQYDRAKGYFEQSLVIVQEIGDREGAGKALNNLGNVIHAQGQYDQALDYYEQSLVIFQEIGNRAAEGVTLNNLGTLALAQSAFHQAQNYYRQALTIRQELNQPHYLVDDWAGLALLASQQSDLETAQAYTDQLLAAWAGNPTFEGAEHPMRAFHFTWQVCQALGLAQADEVLAAAAQVLQTYLDNHPDPATQAVYLRQPHHQALWRAWQAQQEGGGSPAE